MNAYDARNDRTVNDVGTLWRLQRSGKVARCALVTRSRGWELHVLVDGQRLMAERCRRGPNAFTAAASLKNQFMRDGWQAVPTRGGAAPRVPG
jgi:hypothetical protein